MQRKVPIREGSRLPTLIALFYTQLKTIQSILHKLHTAQKRINGPNPNDSMDKIPQRSSG